MLKNKEVFLKKDCPDFLCKYVSLNCEITAKRFSGSQEKIVVFNIREKINAK